jgi:hypothetical protein
MISVNLLMPSFSQKIHKESAMGSKRSIIALQTGSALIVMWIHRQPLIESRR